MPNADTCLYVGIDEAGYGPNLGPLVMTAVSAAGRSARPPRLWDDLAEHVDRARGEANRVWIDDSKRILACSNGTGRLEHAVLGLVTALREGIPNDLVSLARGIGVNDLRVLELDLWSDGESFSLPRETTRDQIESCAHLFGGLKPWRLHAARSVVVSPRAFNEGLSRHETKAGVHFEAFSKLIDYYWGQSEFAEFRVRCDKHGGRHYYMEPLQTAWPGSWITRGAEGPDLSEYTLLRDGRRMHMRFEPRSDACDGLTALASMVSKYVRECWMTIFNAFWQRRVPNLRATAGYPTDAARFRKQIRKEAKALGLPDAHWWRLK